MCYTVQIGDYFSQLLKQLNKMKLLAFSYAKHVISTVTNTKNLVKTFPVTVSIGCFFSYLIDKRRPDAVVSFCQSFPRLLSLRSFV